MSTAPLSANAPTPSAGPLPPEDCAEMADVRAGVDALDRELVQLLTRRQAYMEAAARIKPASSDVRVPWRIEEVVQKVLSEAEKTGLSPRIAEPVWRSLIEQCIAHEYAAWHKVRGLDMPETPEKSGS